MFFSVVTKNLNWNILTMKTFKKLKVLWKIWLIMMGGFTKKQYIRENCQQRGRGLIVCRFKGEGGGGGLEKEQVVFLRGIDTPMPQCILCTGTNTKTKLATKVHQIMVWRKKLSCQHNGQVVYYTKTLQIWCKVC